MLSPSMFREAFSKLSLRKKLTILALVGVLLPVLVLTYLQYRSLTELENKTKGAFKDSLRQRLTNVQLQLKQRLEDVAAQTLEPIGSLHLSSPGAAEELEKYFANVKRSHPEVEEIFAFGYSDDQHNTPAQSRILSLFETSRTTQSFLDDNRNYLFVHNSCPTCPTNTHQGTYLFYPFKDLTKDPAKGEQSGFAGVLL